MGRFAWSPKSKEYSFASSMIPLVGFSDRACAQDGYFKRPHPTIIDGDMWSDSGWFLGGFGVVGHLTRD